MSKIYAESNGEGTARLFNKRFMYKMRSKRSVPGANNIVDFTIGEKKLYGKVHQLYRPIFVKYESRLKPLYNSSSDNTMYAFNFVADLFNEMVNEFVDYYGKNIVNESTLIKGVKEFLIWAKKKNISMAVCTNKQEHLSIDLLKKIGIYDFFEYVAGHNTFDYCKPDPRHLTTVIEILDGDINKSLMIGDSETDANAAKAAGIPIILLEDGYTEKNTTEIYHNHLVKDFVNIEKIVTKYL